MRHITTQERISAFCTEREGRSRKQCVAWQVGESVLLQCSMVCQYILAWCANTYQHGVPIASSRWAALLGLPEDVQDTEI